jgi:hypothetical protein
MALFEFELRDLGKIAPWETSNGPSLSWFALTDGHFRMPVGSEVLFEYTEAVQSQLKQRDTRVDYQIASIARDILECMIPAVTKLPPSVERLASDWKKLRQLEKATEALAESDDSWDLSYDAWRWLGERSPWTSYFVSNPRFTFVRVGDEVRIHWDNRGLEIDGVIAWTAQAGMHVLPVEVFLAECRSFSNRLLSHMEQRIDQLEAGVARAQIAVNIESLREQHEWWKGEFETYFKDRSPDLSWEQTEHALGATAEKIGLDLN